MATPVTACLLFEAKFIAACGSGNVLSLDLVEWLATKQDSLKLYQGEDVSMGIWLAAVHPNQIQVNVGPYIKHSTTSGWVDSLTLEVLQDFHWQCFGVCASGKLSLVQSLNNQICSEIPAGVGMYASPQHTPTELHALWSNLTRCGNPCSCPTNASDDNTGSIRVGRET